MRTDILGIFGVSCKSFDESRPSGVCQNAGAEVTSHMLVHRLIFTAGLFLLNPFQTKALQAYDSLDIKLGQMLMVGFRGTEIDSADDIRWAITDGKIGGVILFDYDVERKSPRRNIVSHAQLKRLIRRLQDLSDIPLFVAIDQEGGRVNRLKEKFGFPKTISQAELGKIDNISRTFEAGKRTGELLQTLGINLNFAPVVDVNVNPNNPVIGKLERSFSREWKAVAAHGIALIEGLHESNVLSAVKHFPGHGSSTGDSHEGFTDVTLTWQPLELEPFKHIIESGLCDVVMTAHIFNARLDSVWPATLSTRTITEILRDSLGYDGVVITDDLQMRAITENYASETAITKAIEAGADILLFGNNAGSYDGTIAHKAITTLRRLVDRGIISPERITKSFQRIMKLKQRLADGS